MSTRTKRIIALCATLALGGACLLDLLCDGFVASFLLRLTYLPIETPHRFASLHLSFILICVVLVLIAPKLSKRITHPTLDKIVFAFGIAFLMLEIYKQLYTSFILADGAYNFGALPFQLCSYITPACLLAPLLPEGKAKEAVYSFVSLFLTMGGCLVIAYPKFYDDLARSLHTMIWHTMMIALGALILCTRTMRIPYRQAVIPSSAVFLTTLVVATALNIALAPLAQNSTEPLNLFYMSPYYPTSYIIISSVWDSFGFWSALVCYILLYLSIGVHTIYLYGLICKRFGSKSLHQNQQLS
jgi:hypothetical protein